MTSPRIDQVVSFWNGGQKLKAISFFIHSLPNLTYPDGPEEMDRLFKQYGYWSFNGAMAGVTWWREVWHFLGGVAIALPFIYFQTVCFIIPFLIMGYVSASEFFEDAKGSPDLKNFVDVLFWTAGAASVTILSFILFGPDTYK